MSQPSALKSGSMKSRLTCVSLYFPLRYASRLRSKFSIRFRTICGAGMLCPLWELGRFACRSTPCVRIAGMARSYRYQMLLQTMYQILRQLRLQFVDRDGDAQFAGLRHAQSGIAARVDVGERGQVHIYIERQAVIAITVLDLQSQRGDLRIVHIHAGSVLASLCGHAEFAEQVDNRLFHQAHQLAHVDFPAANIEQQVSDDLAGAMISDLSAAIDF